LEAKQKPSPEVGKNLALGAAFNLNTESSKKAPGAVLTGQITGSRDIIAGER
jgi:hypothetical protein